MTRRFVLLGLVGIVAVSCLAESKKTSILNHYRKLPRFTPSVLLDELVKRGVGDTEVDELVRDDLMFGKRSRDYQHQTSVLG